MSLFLYLSTAAAQQDAVFPQADGTDHDARVDVMDGMAMGADLAWAVVTLGDEDLRGTAAF